MNGYNGRLISRRELPGNTTSVVIELKEPDFSFTAGQYISLTVPGLDDHPITDQFHDFSIASSDKDPQQIEILFRNSRSIYKQKLLTLPIGSEVTVEGPGGIFTLDNQAKRQVWIAGGIGITPFLSMVRSGIPEDIAVTLYYYDKTGSYVGNDDLNRSSLRVHYVKGRVAATDSIFNNPADKILIVGPPGMVAQIKHTLLQHGIKKSTIQTEEFPGYESSQ